MRITLNLNPPQEELHKVQLTDSEVSALLACDEISFGGSHYKIKHKTFEIESVGILSLSISAEQEPSV